MTTGIRKFVVFAVAILISWIAGASVPPTWTVNRVTLDVLTDDDGRLYYLSEGSPAYFDAVPTEEAQLDAAALARLRRIAGRHRGVRLGGGDARRAGQRPSTTGSSRATALGAGGRCCRPRWR